MIQTRIFNSTEELISATADLLTETLGTPGNLMLSGGSTPYVIYNRLVDTPCPLHPGRRIFLSDERIEPFTSNKNNAHNLEPMLRSLNGMDQFIRVDTAQGRIGASAAFEKQLEPLKTVDLGLLGMGGDGHTAGFFTAEQAAIKKAPLVLHTTRPDGMEGVSVTPAFLKRVQRIILLVTGESKRDIIRTLQDAPQSIPAGIALSNLKNVELWTDIPVD